MAATFQSAASDSVVDDADTSLVVAKPSGLRFRLALLGDGGQGDGGDRNRPVITKAGFGAARAYSVNR